MYKYAHEVFELLAVSKFKTYNFIPVINEKFESHVIQLQNHDRHWHFWSAHSTSKVYDLW